MADNVSFKFDVPDTDMVYVSGLPAGVTEADIETYFGSIGIIKKDKKTKKSKIWLYRDKTTGELKGDGTVSYEDPFSAASAVQWFGEKEWKGGDGRGGPPCSGGASSAPVPAQGLLVSRRYQALGASLHAAP